MDFPDNARKSHSSPVASAGGLIIFPYITCALIYLSFLSFIKLKILFIWIFLYLTFFLTGIIDDKIHDIKIAYHANSIGLLRMLIK